MGRAVPDFRAIARWQAGELLGKGQGDGTCGPGSSRFPGDRPLAGRRIAGERAGGRDVWAGQFPISGQIARRAWRPARGMTDDKKSERIFGVDVP